MTTKTSSSSRHSAYRIPSPISWPTSLVNKIVKGDALKVMRRLPDESVALSVTSPPYWNIVDYEIDGQIGQSGYQEYLDDLLQVWAEAHRVLVPNGKLAIVTPVMPVPKSVIGHQHTRHLKDISADIQQSILAGVPGLELYSVFVWQKQTTEKMFGSYPYPPNIYEDNTTEFIRVLVKAGAPVPLPGAAKEASKISQAEWRNLTMQVWPMYPEDVKRAGGHPCPFPIVLPLRLIKMYTFQRDASAGFEGDIVLDMFNGTGATCVAARAAGRNWIGIDIHPEYCAIARRRVETEPVDPDAIILEAPRVRAARNSKQLSMLPELGLDEEQIHG